jgi:hypothetical protein
MLHCPVRTSTRAGGGKSTDRLYESHNMLEPQKCDFDIKPDSTAQSTSLVKSPNFSRMKSSFCRIYDGGPLNGSMMEIGVR